MLLELAARLGIEHPMETARLFGAWERIVGVEVAARCRPTSLRSGVLKVRAASPAWAAELRYLAPELIRRVNTELGGEVVREVATWVDLKGPREERRESQTNDRLSSPDLRPEDYAEAREAVGAIGDEGLAEAMKRALLAAKMRKRRG